MVGQQQPPSPPSSKPNNLGSWPVRGKRVPRRCSSVRRDELHHCPVQHVEPRAFVYKPALVSLRKENDGDHALRPARLRARILRGRRNARSGTPSPKLIKHGRADRSRRKGTRPAPALIMMSAPSLSCGVVQPAVSNALRLTSRPVQPIHQLHPCVGLSSLLCVRCDSAPRLLPF